MMLSIVGSHVHPLSNEEPPAAQPTTAEDGQTAASEDLIEVTCDAGSCRTFVP